MITDFNLNVNIIMPLNRRLPFFNINKSQQDLDTLRQHESKQRSNSQKPYGFNTIDTDDEMKSEKLFHTICVGNLSSEFLVPCSKNANWVQLEESIIDLFKNNGRLEDGKLKQTHENISSLLNSNFGIFVFERLKSQVLPKAVRLLKADIEDGENYMDTLGSVWKTFYHDILSTLECMLFSIEPFNNVSIRKTTLVIFRDQVLVNSPLEKKLKELLERNKKTSKDIVHMILIVQSVFERYPPSENKLKMEKIAALTISPYLGYYGIYENYNQVPMIKSKEPYNIPLLGRPFEKPCDQHVHHVPFNKPEIFNRFNCQTTSDIKQTTNKETSKSRNRKISLPHFSQPKNQNHMIGRINE